MADGATDRNPKTDHRSIAFMCGPWLLSRELDVLVGRRVGMAGDQAKTQLRNPWTGGVNECQCQIGA